MAEVVRLDIAKHEISESQVFFNGLDRTRKAPIISAEKTQLVK